MNRGIRMCVAHAYASNSVLGGVGWGWIPARGRNDGCREREGMTHGGTLTPLILLSRHRRTPRRIYDIFVP